MGIYRKDLGGLYGHYAVKSETYYGDLPAAVEVVTPDHDNGAEWASVEVEVTVPGPFPLTLCPRIPAADLIELLAEAGLCVPITR